jgi:hypothetical protein
MKNLTITIFCFLSIALLGAGDNGDSTVRTDDLETWTIKKTTDFEVTGDGTAENWNLAEWMIIPQRRGKSLETKAKILYSESGIYFLFSCQDEKVTASMEADFMDLWKEDVVEVFLWPDETIPFYFEYEISPLNYELPILISNQEGDLLRWKPFHYEEDRKTRHATSIRGGIKESNASITSWTAEFYIPYKLLMPLKNIPPISGSKWRANFYRVDYDGNKSVWSWKKTITNFHQYEKFGHLLFE